jgi:hypothetical protein
MVRPKLLKDAKVISLVFDRVDLDIVEKERGTLGTSDFIRKLIRQTQKGVKGKEDSEKKLQKELRDVKAKLGVFERKELAIAQEHLDKTHEIAEDFVGYLALYPNASKTQQDNWLSSRCKDSYGVSPIEIRSSIELGGISIEQP